MSSASGTPDSGPAGNVAANRPYIPDYELVRVVGRGSYGDVWLARSVTGAWRAIKVVWRERFTNAEPFEREFRGLKEFADVSLGESSQMALLHVGRNDPAGFFYSVMELADDAERGRHIDPASYVPLTLAELRTRRDRIPADECARFGVGVARALASLHRRGLVHRDVKPSNVILVAGVPKLADIGLVAPAATARTFVGTEGYVPPEGPGSPSADVFALGKMLYELSTGHDRQEFPKLPAQVARLPDRAVLFELNEIILRACGPNAAERYRDGAAILTDLTALNAGVSLRTRRLARFALRSVTVIALLAALVFGGWYWQFRLRPPLVAPGVESRSVALLPFENATGDPTLEDYADGLSDEILHALEREHDLRVTGSRSSYFFKGTKVPPVEIARRLGVAQFVTGSMRRAGTRLHLGVRLIRGIDGASEEIGAFEHEAGDVFALEDEVARAVAQKILAHVTMAVLEPTTKNPGAYEEFLRGRALQLGDMTKAAESAKHFARATELDPAFAVAWARRADALRMAGTKGVHGVWDCQEALVAVERSLTLQPKLALGWAVRGLIRGVGQNDAPAGLRDLDRAEELGGTNAETRMTRFLLSYFASETLGMLPRAREAIASNPENIERVAVVTLGLSYIGDFADADRLLAQTGNFFGRVSLRRTWRGAEAALRLAERAAPNPAAGIAARVSMLAEMNRITEAAKLVSAVSAPLPLEVYVNAGRSEQARALAAEQILTLQKEFAAIGIPRNESEMLGRDGTRSKLILAEIVLAHHEVALSLVEAWRGEMEKRTPGNRRAGGPFMMNLPRYYAMLGKQDAAIDVLTEFMKVGRTLGYDLRDSAAFALLRENPRFLDLRRRAEEWAAMQPDPAEEPALSPRTSL